MFIKFFFVMIMWGRVKVGKGNHDYLPYRWATRGFESFPSYSYFTGERLTAVDYNIPSSPCHNARVV